jgi:hypothetical protein
VPHSHEGTISSIKGDNMHKDELDKMLKELERICSNTRSIMEFPNPRCDSIAWLMLSQVRDWSDNNLWRYHESIKSGI